MSAPATSTPAAVLAAYTAWLDQQPLAAHTRRAYRQHVGQFCAFLTTYPAPYGDPFHEPPARDYAARDFKAHLLAIRQAKPRSVNLALAALDHLYRFLGLGSPQVSRADLPQQAPRALAADEQVRFLRAVEREASVRDRALVLLLFYTGLRLGEATTLNDADVLLSARKGRVIVRLGKGHTYREVPLNSEVREALTAWLHERHKQFAVAPGSPDERALFLSRHGQRLSARAIDLVLRRLARAAGLSLSAHTLRHTCLTNLVRQGTDLVLVAELAGHKRLETTRRYSLPSADDREAAMERLRVRT
jgi:integrase/recombinase XerC